MSDLLESYRELNPNNYDDEDLRNLVCWANDAFDEISVLQDKIALANKRLDLSWIDDLPDNPDSLAQLTKLGNNL